MKFILTLIATLFLLACNNPTSNDSSPFQDVQGTWISQEEIAYTTDLFQPHKVEHLPARYQWTVYDIREDSIKTSVYYKTHHYFLVTPQLELQLDYTTTGRHSMHGHLVHVKGTNTENYIKYDYATDPTGYKEKRDSIPLNKNEYKNIKYLQMEEYPFILRNDSLIIDDKPLCRQGTKQLYSYRT